MDELIKSLVNSGPSGIAIAVMLLTGWIYHKTRIAELKTHLEESRNDKKDAQAVIVGNTEAMTKLCSAVDNCTESNRQVQAVVQRLLERGERCN